MGCKKGNSATKIESTRSHSLSPSSRGWVSGLSAAPPLFRLSSSAAPVKQCAVSNSGERPRVLRSSILSAERTSRNKFFVREYCQGLSERRGVNGRGGVSCPAMAVPGAATCLLLWSLFYLDGKLDRACKRLVHVSVYKNLVAFPKSRFHLSRVSIKC